MHSKSRSRLQFCVVPRCTQQLRLFILFFSLFLIDVFSLFQYSLCLSSTSFFLTSAIFQSTFFFTFFYIHTILPASRQMFWLEAATVCRAYTLQREQQMHITRPKNLYIQAAGRPAISEYSSYNFIYIFSLSPSLVG